MNKTQTLAKQTESIFRMAPLNWKKTPVRRIIQKTVTFEEGITDAQKEAITPGIGKLIAVAMLSTALLIGLLLYWFW